MAEEILMSILTIPLRRKRAPTPAAPFNGTERPGPRAVESWDDLNPSSGTRRGGPVARSAVTLLHPASRWPVASPAAHRLCRASTSRALDRWRECEGDALATGLSALRVALA